jgi:phospholipid transport system substrate-binding protein
MNFIRTVRGIVFLSLSLVFFNSWANTSPIPLLQSKANQIIAQLQKNKADLRSNPRISYNIVTQYLVPMVDQNAMAQAAVGRNVWNNPQTTESQKRAFIKEFRTLVIRSYAAAIAQFSNETIQFMPILVSLNSGSAVTVKSQIIRTNGAPKIMVNYTVVPMGSQWKIIDFTIDGISMVQSFKAQFQSQLSSGNLQMLIDTLKTHNSRNN